MSELFRLPSLSTPEPAMAHHIEVRLRAAATGETTSRFQNLGEDVYRELGRITEVDIDEIDAATEVFTVRAIRRRDLGRVADRLSHLIRAHNFEGDIDLIREEGRVLG